MMVLQGDVELHGKLDANTASVYVGTPPGQPMRVGTPIPGALGSMEAPHGTEVFDGHTRATKIGH